MNQSWPQKKGKAVHDWEPMHKKYLINMNLSFFSGMLMWMVENLRKKRLFPQTPLCQDWTPVSTVSHKNHNTGLAIGQPNEPCSLATKVLFGALCFCNSNTWDLQRPEFCWREAHHTQEAITFNAKWHPLLAFGHAIVLSLPFRSYIWELESSGQLGLSPCKVHKNIHFNMVSWTWLIGVNLWNFLKLAIKTNVSFLTLWVSTG